MKFPLISYYSFYICFCATLYLILSLIKMKQAKKKDNIENDLVERSNIYAKDIHIGKFALKILKIIYYQNMFKIFFVNCGEKLINLQCEGLNNNAKLEIEEIDANVSNNETGVIIVTNKKDDLREVELLFKYFSEQKYYKTKHVKINITTKEINIVE